MGQLDDSKQLCTNMACETIGCCRVCAQRHHDMVSVFDEQGKCRQLFLKLQICLQITVMKHAYLPTTICSPCAAKLEVCYELMRLRKMGENVFQKIQFASDRTCSSPEESESTLIPLTSRSQYWNMDSGSQEFTTKVRKPKTRWIESGLGLFDTNPQPGPSRPEEMKVQDCGPYVPSPISALSDVSEQNSQMSDISASGSSTAEVQEQRPATSRSPKKIISCEFCNKCFNHTGDLNKHRRSHTGERPYGCNQCDKKFSHASNLLRHRKIHSGERPFQCPTCGKSFSRKDKMLSHIKTAICIRRSESNLRTYPQATTSQQSFNYLSGFISPPSPSSAR